jgi:hypothetical protein
MSVIRTKNYIISCENINPTRFSQFNDVFGVPSKVVNFLDTITNLPVFGFIVNADTSITLAYHIKSDLELYMGCHHSGEYMNMSYTYEWDPINPAGIDVTISLLSGEISHMRISISPPNMEHHDVKNGDLILSFILGDDIRLPVVSQDVVLSFKEAEAFANELESFRI